MKKSVLTFVFALLCTVLFAQKFELKDSFSKDPGSDVLKDVEKISKIPYKYLDIEVKDDVIILSYTKRNGKVYRVESVKIVSKGNTEEGLSYNCISVKDGNLMVTFTENKGLFIDTCEDFSIDGIKNTKFFQVF